MATPNFDGLVDKFLAWSNRDRDVFGGNPTNPNGLIPDFIRYAADKAYRTLRVPALEKSEQILIPNNATGDENNIDPDLVFDERVARSFIHVPADLIEFIHIRKVDTRFSDLASVPVSIVLNNKADTRTFHDFDSEKYDPDFTWTRQGNCILISPTPGVQAGDEFEIFYYGRGAALNETYDVTEFNRDLRVFDNGTSEGSTNTILTVVSSGGTTLDDGIMYTGNEAFNWLRDENERILLFGALGEGFAYLQEDDQSGKYFQLFNQEIDELNKEEQQRHGSGGNVQINFNGRGLI